MSEAITGDRFAEQLISGQLALSLVGMSNVGKSHWSEILESEAGFERYCCDDLIEAKLGTELTDLGFAGGINDMAKWMGQPYEEQYDANSRRYLDLEAEITLQVIKRIQEQRMSGGLVIDTTGSVVHTGEEIVRHLEASSTVVYLEATPEMQEEMFRRYIANPKPVVWGDAFKAAPEETDEDALKRCYPDLLERRSGLYAAMAHVTLPHEVAWDLESADDFLNYIRTELSE